MRTRLWIALAVPLLLMAPLTEAQGADEPYRFFREFAGLGEDQIGAIRSGKPVARLSTLALLTKYSSLARFT